MSQPLEVSVTVHAGGANMMANCAFTLRADLCPASVIPVGRPSDVVRRRRLQIQNPQDPDQSVAVAHAPIQQQASRRPLSQIEDVAAGPPADPSKRRRRLRRKTKPEEDTLDDAMKGVSDDDCQVIFSDIVSPPEPVGGLQRGCTKLRRGRRYRCVCIACSFRDYL